jgi:GDPmannose 4,6-dehydratase
MKNCLILGVNGQDGSFLAEILMAESQILWGLGRQPTARYLTEQASFHYHQCDLMNQAKLKEILNSSKPDEIYHVAALHGSHGFTYEDIWGDALDVNVKSLYTALEYARTQKADIRIFYASSAKVFGSILKGRISLESPKRHDCLYSVSKLAAENLLDYYRKVHHVHASAAYLFNHESVRRPADYFIPKVMVALQSAIKHKQARIKFHTLDFYCDWGCAREYMEMAIALIRMPVPKDIIFATGMARYGRDFVREIFAGYGLDHRDYILETAPNVDSQFFQVDIAETVDHLGSGPKRTIFDVCRDFIK